LGDSDEREAFHAAIWKAPDDDLPRLVYADWLDERGEDDLAAFLRLLCAVRTCPPDVDRLRPLAVEFRRAMVKLPAKWVDDVCPVPPAVVVGAWVDVDHEANRAVLELIRQRRRARTGLQPAGDLIHVRPEQQVRWPSQEVVDRLWGDLQPELSPAAACAVDGVPALVDVWSGVVMAVAADGDGFVVRGPEGRELPGSSSRSLVPYDPELERLRGHARRHLGSHWLVCGSDPERMWSVARWLRSAATEFDPANRPG
jgi:uncharacterized protein (TIGR02996 family)